MDRAHTQFDRRMIVILVPLVLVAIAVPWALQDPGYKKLGRVPLELAPPKGVRIEQVGKLLGRHESNVSVGKRYLAQFTFEVTNRRASPVRGLTFSLVGTDRDGRSLFRVPARPPVLDLQPGATEKVFVRIKELDHETISKLGGMALQGTVTIPDKPR